MVMLVLTSSMQSSCMVTSSELKIPYPAEPSVAFTGMVALLLKVFTHKFGCCNVGAFVDVVIIVGVIEGVVFDWLGAMCVGSIWIFL